MLHNRKLERLVERLDQRTEKLCHDPEMLKIIKLLRLPHINNDQANQIYEVIKDLHFFTPFFNSI